MLWTRLAPEPLDGGGMPARDVEVGWQVAADEAMRDVVAAGTALAGPDLGHSVHVDVGGLEPGRPYWYRFVVGDDETPVARTRTAPADGATGGRARFAHVSCQRYDAGLYTAYADIAADDLDLVIHCGDYIYERGAGEGPRADPLAEAIDLEGYRNRYALYKGDEDLRAAHAVAPWVVTWDDHEVENNYTSDVPEEGSDTPSRSAFLARRAAAYQAWWEHTPVRLPPPSGPDLRVYRDLGWGGLARLHVLDTRQHRSEQMCGADGPAADVGPRCDAASDEGRTVLGADQESWLSGRLAASDARWDVVVQQVVVMQWRFAPGNTVWNLDQWDGYPAARERFLDQLARSSSPVVLTGDVHSSWVGSLARDFDDPRSEVVGAEFVGTSVSSLPGAVVAAVPVVSGNSPHLRWAEAEHRGWVRHEVTAEEWRADYRLVEDATVEGSPVSTATSWVVPHGGTVTEA